MRIADESTGGYAPRTHTIGPGATIGRQSDDYGMGGSGGVGSSMTLYLSGEMVSGKNQVGIVVRNGKPHRFPNKRFEAWKQDMSDQILRQLIQIPKEKKPSFPLMGNLVLSVRYAPGDRHRRDISGMSDALFHLLEHAGIIDNDYQFKSLHFVTEPANPGRPMAMELRLEEQS